MRQITDSGKLWDGSGAAMLDHQPTRHPMKQRRSFTAQQRLQTVEPEGGSPQPTTTLILYGALADSR